MVTSMLTVVVATFGAVHTFFVMTVVSLVGSPNTRFVSVIQIW